MNIKWDGQSGLTIYQSVDMLEVEIVNVINEMMYDLIIRCAVRAISRQLRRGPFNFFNGLNVCR